MFFVTEHFIKSSNPKWHLDYLWDRDFRITSILKNEYGNDFWSTYSYVLLDYVSSEKLLFRAKITLDDCINFFQIWVSEKEAHQFSKDANSNRSPLKSLVEHGFNVEFFSREINFDEAESLIKNSRKRPHLLQFVNKIFYKDDMITGDPLKAGRGYLPFPTK